MSDFLNNLAAKTLNLADVVQPRLTSLFEPPAVAGGRLPGRPSSDVEMAQSEPSLGETSFETPQTAQAFIRDSVEARPSRMSLKRPPAPPQYPLPFLTPLTPSPAQALSTRPPALSLQPEAVKPSETAVRPSETKVFIPLTAENETGTEPLRNTGGQENPSALERNIWGIVDERVAALEAQRPKNLGHAASVPIPVIQSAKPVPVVAHRHETPSIVPAASVPAELVVTPAPGPTIRITIGRVDVRAIMPAPPAPRPTPARSGPSLSLEDYLKQREGGRR